MGEDPMIAVERAQSARDRNSTGGLSNFPVVARMPNWRWLSISFGTALAFSIGLAMGLAALLFRPRKSGSNGAHA